MAEKRDYYEVLGWLKMLEAAEIKKLSEARLQYHLTETREIKQRGKI